MSHTIQTAGKASRPSSVTDSIRKKTYQRPLGRNHTQKIEGTLIRQDCGLVSVYEADGWREVWHRQIDGVGLFGVGVMMTRCGKWVVAAPISGYFKQGGRARLMSVGGDIDTPIGVECVWGIGVGGGGKRVVTSHRNPNRCEVSGGVGKVVNVDGDAGSVAIVDGGSGMLIVSGDDVVYFR